MNSKKIVAFSLAGTLALVATVASAASRDSAAASALQGPGECANQPNMASSLAQLRAARASLDHAEHNKGGWRDAAIQASERAIRETVRGCAFANR